MSERLNTIPDEEIQSDKKNNIYWEGPFCYVNGKKYFPKISLDSIHPKDHNSVFIELNGKSNSDLNWSDALNKAEDAISQGKYIFWFLNLGLFSELSFSLFNQSQFLTLSLAIEHFNKAVWENFKEFTLGVCIFKGDANFYSSFMDDIQHEENFTSWINEHAPNNCISLKDASNDLQILYAFDSGIEYLDLLSHIFNENLECFIMLDTTSIVNPIMQARLLISERSERLKFITKNSLIPPDHITWDQENSPFGFIGKGTERIHSDKSALAICLPLINKVDFSFYISLEEIIFYLIEKKYCFRIVSEANLTAEWDGLDTLIVDESTLSPLGLRKLHGFFAAGGEIVCLKEIPSLPTLRNFNEWKKEKHENFLWIGDTQKK